MYEYTSYSKLKHVVTAALYAAILLTEAGEFFVSNPYEIQIGHNTQVQHEREIPEHTPKKYETVSLRVLKVCKQKLIHTKDGNHSADAVCFVVSILKGSGVGNLSEINHKFIG